MSVTRTPNGALREAVGIAGGQSATGRLLGVSQHAVWRWLNEEKPLPAEHVLTVERRTGISRYDLRPDLYPRESAEPAHPAPPARDTRDTMAPAR